MKILHVIDELNVGGAEKVFVTICNLLYKNHLDVNCLFLVKGGKLKQEINSEIPIYELERYSKWNVTKLFVCRNILKKFDIIHCHLKHVYLYIQLVCTIFKLNCKVILHNHSSKSLSFREIILLKYLFKPKNIIVVDKTSKELFKTKIKINDTNIFLLYNIITLKDNKTYHEKQYDLVLIGNVKENKNNIFAVELAQELNMRLLIVGKNQDNYYYQNLKNKINTSNFIEIREDIDDVSNILNKCKLGLLVSYRETGPIVLLEYLYSGIPFLAYETGEISKILKEDIPDFFVDSFDKNIWKEKVKDIISAEYDKNKLKEIVTQNFGENDFYSKLILIYKWVQKS